MSREKSEKELAYLRDLYIAPDWGERFAGLIDENIALPKEGRVLYIASGTGAHALAVLARAGKNVTLVCVDESEECIELSRAKANALKLNPEFRRNQFEALDLDDDQFELVIGDTSLVPVERLPEIIAEMVRVTAPGGTVALSVATAPSFGEFFSIYWEALENSGIQNHEHDVESLIIHVPTVSDVEEIAKASGLEKVTSSTRSEEFDYASGQEFLESPLIADFLLTSWRENLPDTTDREKVDSELVRIIDEERSGMDFALSVKATLVTGRKPE